MPVHHATLALTLLSVLAVSACTSPAATPEPSPSIDLAAEFLAVVCPANEADLAFNEIWSDESSPLEAKVDAAATAQTADAEAAAAFAALADRWPTAYTNDLAIIRDMYLAKVEDYTSIAQATSLDPIYDAVFQNPTAGNAAYERIARSIGTSVGEC